MWEEKKTVKGKPCQAEQRLDFSARGASTGLRVIGTQSNGTSLGDPVSGSKLLNNHWRAKKEKITCKWSREKTFAAGPWESEWKQFFTAASTNPRQLRDAVEDNERARTRRIKWSSSAVLPKWKRCYPEPSRKPASAKCGPANQIRRGFYAREHPRRDRNKTLFALEKKGPSVQ